MLRSFVTPIKLSLRRKPTLLVGIQTFIVWTLQRLEFLFNFLPQRHKVAKYDKDLCDLASSAFVALKSIACLSLSQTILKT